SAGLRVFEATTVALRFDLAESLFVRQDGAVVLSPVVRAFDTRFASSLDVSFAFAQAVSTHASFQSSQVVLLDGRQRPVAIQPITALAGGTFGSQFRFLDASEGPFIAELVPAPGFRFSQAVAVSVDVRVSVRVEAQVSIQSLSTQRVSSTTSIINIQTSSSASIVQ